AGNNNDGGYAAAHRLLPLPVDSPLFLGNEVRPGRPARPHAGSHPNPTSSSGRCVVLRRCPELPLCDPHAGEDQGDKGRRDRVRKAGLWVGGRMETDDDASGHETNRKASGNHVTRDGSMMDYAPMILAGIAGLALWAVLHFLNELPPLISVIP